MEDRNVVEAYRAYAPAVYARCVRLLRNRESARDVTQEVFLRCHKERGALRPGRELLAWLYRVATNLCLNALRAQRLRSERPTVDTEGAHPATGPERQTVLQILAGLDARVQSIAIFVHVDGMTHAEAAEVARVSERTVRNCLSRFRKHAREVLGETEEDHDTALSI